MTFAGTPLEDESTPVGGKLDPAAMPGGVAATATPANPVQTAAPTAKAAPVAPVETPAPTAPAAETIGFAGTPIDDAPTGFAGTPIDEPVATVTEKPVLENETRTPVYLGQSKAGGGDSLKLAYERDIKRETGNAWSAFGNQLLGIIGFGAAKAVREDRVTSDILADKYPRAVGTPGQQTAMGAAGGMPQMKVETFKLSEQPVDAIAASAKAAGIRADKVEKALRDSGGDPKAFYESVKQLAAGETVKREMVAARADEALQGRGQTKMGYIAESVVPQIPYTAGFLLYGMGGPVGLTALVAKTGLESADKFATDRYDVTEDGQIIRTKAGDEAGTALDKGMLRSAVTVGVETGFGKAVNYGVKGALKLAKGKAIGDAIFEEGMVRYATRNWKPGIARKMVRNAVNVFEATHMDGFHGEYLEEVVDPIAASLLGVSDEYSDRPRVEALKAEMKDLFNVPAQGQLVIGLLGLQALGALAGLPLVVKGNIRDKSVRRSTHEFLTTAGVSKADADLIVAKDEWMNVLTGISNIPEEKAQSILAGLSDRSASVVAQVNNSFAAKKDAKNYTPDFDDAAIEDATSIPGDNRLGKHLHTFLDGKTVTLTDMNSGLQLGEYDVSTVEGLDALRAEAADASRFNQAMTAQRNQKAQFIKDAVTRLGIETDVYFGATRDDVAKELRRIGQDKHAAMFESGQTYAMSLGGTTFIALDAVQSPEAATQAVLHEVGVHDAITRAFKDVKNKSEITDAVIGAVGRREAMRLASGELTRRFTAEARLASEGEARDKAMASIPERVRKALDGENDNALWIAMEEVLASVAEKGVHTAPEKRSRLETAVLNTFFKDEAANERIRTFVANKQAISQKEVAEGRARVLFYGYGNTYDENGQVQPDENDDTPPAPSPEAPVSEPTDAGDAGDGGAPAPAAPAPTAPTPQPVEQPPATPVAPAPIPEGGVLPPAPDDVVIPPTSGDAEARPTRHRVFEGGSPLTLKAPNTLRATDTTKAYRLTSRAQIDDMIEAGGVRAREGKMKGGHAGEVHWSAGHETLGYAPRDNAYVIETSKAELNDRVGSLPNTDVRIWRARNGAWEDATSELSKPVAATPVPVETPAPAPVEEPPVPVTPAPTTQDAPVTEPATDALTDAERQEIKNRFDYNDEDMAIVEANPEAARVELQKARDLEAGATRDLTPKPTEPVVEQPKAKTNEELLAEHLAANAQKPESVRVIESPVKEGANRVEGVTASGENKKLTAVSRKIDNFITRLGRKYGVDVKREGNRVWVDVPKSKRHSGQWIGANAASIAPATRVSVTQRGDGTFGVTESELQPSTKTNRSRVADFLSAMDGETDGQAEFLYPLLSAIDVGELSVAPELSDAQKSEYDGIRDSILPPAIAKKLFVEGKKTNVTQAVKDLYSDGAGPLKSDDVGEFWSKLLGEVDKYSAWVAAGAKSAEQLVAEREQGEKAAAEDKAKAEKTKQPEPPPKPDEPPPAPPVTPPAPPAPPDTRTAKQKKIDEMRANIEAKKAAKAAPPILDGGTIGDIQRDKDTIKAQKKAQKDREDLVERANKPITGNMGDNTAPLPLDLGKPLDDDISLFTQPPAATDPNAARTAKLKAFLDGGRSGIIPTDAEMEGRFKLEDSQAYTPAFKSWFGSSKIVNGDGRPTVALHATNKDFTVFDEGAPTRWPSPNRELGFWFTDDATTADGYQRGVQGERVMQVYLSIKNPARAADYRALVDAYVVEKRPDRYPTAKDVRAGLIAKGHDGVVFTHEDGTRTFVAFRANQVKSATDNNGMFDPASDDVRFKLVTEPTEIAYLRFRTRLRKFFLDNWAEYYDGAADMLTELSMDAGDDAENLLRFVEAEFDDDLHPRFNAVILAADLQGDKDDWMRALDLDFAEASKYFDEQDSASFAADAAEIARLEAEQKAAEAEAKREAKKAKVETGTDVTRREQGAVNTTDPRLRKGVKFLHGETMKLDDGTVFPMPADTQIVVTNEDDVETLAAFDGFAEGMIPSVWVVSIDTSANNAGNIIVYGWGATEDDAAAMSRNRMRVGNALAPATKPKVLLFPARIGVTDRLNGANATQTDIKATYGLADKVNFGKSISEAGANAERQTWVNGLTESFADMAEVLGIPPAAIGFGGGFHMAVGVTGKGSASAHYIPDTGVVNLTRKNGAGALAHEWWHHLQDWMKKTLGMSNADMFPTSDSLMFPGNRTTPVSEAYMRLFDAMHNVNSLTNDRDAREKATGMKAGVRTQMLADGYTEAEVQSAFKGDSVPQKTTPGTAMFRAYAAYANYNAADGSNAVTAFNLAASDKDHGKAKYWMTSHEKMARILQDLTAFALAKRGTVNSVLTDYTFPGESNARDLSAAGVVALEKQFDEFTKALSTMWTAELPSFKARPIPPNVTGMTTNDDVTAAKVAVDRKVIKPQENTSVKKDAERLLREAAGLIKTEKVSAERERKYAASLRADGDIGRYKLEDDVRETKRDLWRKIEDCTIPVKVRVVRAVSSMLDDVRTKYQLARMLDGTGMENYAYDIERMLKERSAYYDDTGYFGPMFDQLKLTTMKADIRKQLLADGYTDEELRTAFSKDFVPRKQTSGTAMLTRYMSKLEASEENHELYKGIDGIVTAHTEKVPPALREPLSQAQEDWRINHPGMTAKSYLMNKLDITETELDDALSIGQQDTVVFALSANDVGRKGFLVAHQAGFGKGRVLAAIMRGLAKGRLVFFTERPDLWGDFGRDAAALNVTKKMFATDQESENIIFSEDELRPDGTVIEKVLFSAPAHGDSSSKMKTAANNKLIANAPFGDSIIMTTYDQMKEDAPAFFDALDNEKPLPTPEKNKFAAILAYMESGDVTIVADESHNAAGDDSNTNRMLKYLADMSKFTVFSSGTAATSLDSLVFYTPYLQGAQIYAERGVFLSALRGLGVDMVGEVVKSIVEHGSMLRFEAYTPDVQMFDQALHGSKDGDADEIAAETERAITVANGLNGAAHALDVLQRTVGSAFAVTEDDQASAPKGREIVGLSSAMTSNSAYNIISGLAKGLSEQGWLASKIDAVVRQVVYDVDHGIAPSLGFFNTNESLLSGLENGEDVSAVSVLRTKTKAAIERMFIVTRKANQEGVMADDVEGDSTYDLRTEQGINRLNQRFGGKFIKMTTPKTGQPKAQFTKLLSPLMASDMRDAYQQVTDAINGYLDDLEAVRFTMSPMDTLREKIEAAYTGDKKILVVEATGRKFRVLNGKKAAYDNEEYRRGRKVRRVTAAFADYNARANGRVVMIYNTAANSGVSGHLKKDTPNQARRRTYFLQIPPNPAEYEQMIFRFSRKNQVEKIGDRDMLPEVFFFASPVPAEKRMMEKSKQKIDALSAVTSGAKSARLAVGEDNMVNEYGDLAAHELTTGIYINQMRSYGFKTDKKIGKVSGAYLMEFLLRVQSMPTTSQTEILQELDDAVDKLREDAIAKETFHGAVESVRADSMKPSLITDRGYMVAMVTTRASRTIEDVAISARKEWMGNRVAAAAMLNTYKAAVSNSGSNLPLGGAVADILRRVGDQLNLSDLAENISAGLTDPTTGTDSGNMLNYGSNRIFVTDFRKEEGSHSLSLHGYVIDAYALNGRKMTIRLSHLIELHRDADKKVNGDYHFVIQINRATTPFFNRWGRFDDLTHQERKHRLTTTGDVIVKDLIAKTNADERYRYVSESKHYIISRNIRDLGLGLGELIVPNRQLAVVAIDVGSETLYGVNVGSYKDILPVTTTQLTVTDFVREPLTSSVSSAQLTPFGISYDVGLDGKQQLLNTQRRRDKASPEAFGKRLSATATDMGLKGSAPLMDDANAALGGQVTFQTRTVATPQRVKSGVTIDEQDLESQFAANVAPADVEDYILGQNSTIGPLIVEEITTPESLGVFDGGKWVAKMSDEIGELVGANINTPFVMFKPGQANAEYFRIGNDKGELQQITREYAETLGNGVGAIVAVNESAEYSTDIIREAAKIVTTGFDITKFDEVYFNNDATRYLTGTAVRMWREKKAGKYSFTHAAEVYGVADSPEGKSATHLTSRYKFTWTASNLLSRVIAANLFTLRLGYNATTTSRVADVLRPLAMGVPHTVKQEVVMLVKRSLESATAIAAAKLDENVSPNPGDTDYNGEIRNRGQIDAEIADTGRFKLTDLSPRDQQLMDAITKASQHYNQAGIGYGDLDDAIVEGVVGGFRDATNAQRAAFGEPPYEAGNLAPHTHESLAEQAIAILQNEPARLDTIAARVNNSKDGQGAMLTDLERVVLTVGRQVINRKARAASLRASSAIMPAASKQAAMESLFALVERDNILRMAQDLAGTAAGRALNAIKASFTPALDLTYRIGAAEKVKGSRLNEAEVAALRGEIDALKGQKEALEATIELLRRQQDAKTPKTPRTPTTPTPTKPRVTTLAVRSKVSSYHEKNPTMSIDDIFGKVATEMGVSVSEIARAVTATAKFALDSNPNPVGGTPVVTMSDWWKQVEARAAELSNETPAPSTGTGLGIDIGEDEDEDSPKEGNIALEAVKLAVDALGVEATREDIVAWAISHVQDTSLVGITPDEFEQAVIQYNKHPVSDARTEAQYRVAQLKAELLWHQRYNDILNGVVPEKRGNPATPHTQEAREWHRKFGETFAQMLKDGKIPESEKNRQLASFNSRLRTTLENRIADLQKAYDAGQLIPASEPRDNKWSDENVALKAELDQLKKLYEGMDVVKEALDEKRVKKAQDRLVYWQARRDDAARGVFKGKRVEQPMSDRLREIRDRIVETQQEIDRMKAEDPRQVAERVAAYVKLATDQIEAIDARIAAGAPVRTATAPLSAYQIASAAQREALRLARIRERDAWRLENADLWEAERIRTRIQTLNAGIDAAEARIAANDYVRDTQRAKRPFNKEIYEKERKLKELNERIQFEGDKIANPTIFTAKALNSVYRFVRQSLDMSAIGLQAADVLRTDLLFNGGAGAREILGDAWLGLKDPSHVGRIVHELLQDPETVEAIRLGLDVTKVFDELTGGSLAEYMVENIEDRFPVIRPLTSAIEASQRHFLVTSLLARVMEYKKLLRSAPEGFEWSETEKRLFVTVANTTTGVGDVRILGLGSRAVGNGIGKILWAARLTASQVQRAFLLNGILGFGAERGIFMRNDVSGEFRKAIVGQNLKHLTSFVALNVALKVLLAAIGWSLPDDDPNEDGWFDFLFDPPNIGGTEIDVSGRVTTMRRSVLKLIGADRNQFSARSGNQASRAQGGFDTLNRMTSGRLSPDLAFAWSTILGETPFGDPFGPFAGEGNRLAGMKKMGVSLTPLAIEQASQLDRSRGMLATAAMMGFALTGMTTGAATTPDYRMNLHKSRMSLFNKESDPARRSADWRERQAKMREDWATDFAKAPAVSRIISQANKAKEDKDTARYEALAEVADEMLR